MNNLQPPSAIRVSNVELLKIIAIFLIIVSHIAQTSGLPQVLFDANKATYNIQFLIIDFFLNLGKVGNVIFICCSSWFLCDSKKLKTENL